MARILFTVPPLTGHLNPALAVAAVLQAQGHTVAWAIHATQLRDKLPAGAQIYALDDQAAFDLSVASPLVRGLESVRVFFEDFAMPLARSVLAPLEQAARAFQPDVMVVDHQMLGGALVARKLGLPWVSLVTTSASILRMSAMLDEWVEAQFLALQQDYLPASAVVQRPDFSPYQVVVFSVEALLGTQHERVLAPYVFVGPPQGSGRRAVDFPWEWLQKDSRRILVSLGTVSRDRDTRFFEVMMEAFTGLEVQAILVAPESLAAIAPPNVLVRAYVPQLELLGCVHAVICHAGHNTVCEALSRGLPLALAPIRDDQPVIARQVIDAGAGVFIRHGKVSPAMARKAILELLDNPELAKNAQKIAVELAAAHGEHTAAAAILQLVRA